MGRQRQSNCTQLMMPLVGFMNTHILYVQLITDLTESLTPDSVNVMWSSQLFRDECPLKEEWFGTPYSSEGYFPESHFSAKTIPLVVFFTDIPALWKDAWRGMHDLC